MVRHMCKPSRDYVILNDCSSICGQVTNILCVVQVPANAAIVQTLRARASAEADERAQIKRLTLAADQRAQLENGTKPTGPQIIKITQPALLTDQEEQLNALLRPPRQKARSYLSQG